MSKAVEGLRAGDPGVVKPGMLRKASERMQDKHLPNTFRMPASRGEVASVLPAAAGKTAPNLTDSAEAPVPTHAETMEFIGRAGELDLFAEFELDHVAGIWSAFETSAWFTPFQKSEWIRAWYARKANRTQMRPIVILAYVGSTLRLLLPLAIEFSPVGNRLVWLAQAVNDYNAPLIDREYLPRVDEGLVRRICSSLCDRFPEIDLIRFARQPATIAGQSNPFVFADAVRCASDSHILDLNGDWAAIYPALRSPKSRRRLREKLAKLRKSGDVRFRRACGTIETDRLIRRAVAWKSRQLDATGARNPFSTRDQDPFAGSGLAHALVTMSKSAGAEKTLRAYGLFVDDEPVAIIVALVSHRTFHMFMTAVDPERYSKVSVGTLLLMKTIELAARAGYRCYDFLAGDEAYKLDWCNRRLDLYEVALGVTALGKGRAAILRGQLHAKRELKASPRAMRVLQTLNLLRVRLADHLSRDPAVASGALVNQQPAESPASVAANQSHTA